MTDDRSIQCQHCGVDMVIESELKKHVHHLLEHSLASSNLLTQPLTSRSKEVISFVAHSAILTTWLKLEMLMNSMVSHNMSPTNHLLPARSPISSP